MDTLATNDKRLPHEQIQRIRNLRPDMILLSGGIDGGTVSHVVELAEIIGAANPRPRLGLSYQLPVIYAGNVKARENIEQILGDKAALDIIENLRPTMERENLMPARLKIQELFLEHVMAQAPGYKKLMAMTDVDIMPTPAAVGDIMQRISEQYGIQVVGVDIGGATTDVFSVFKGIFNRTVSANLGMSYSVSNVFAEAGIDNVMRWVPFDMDERDLRNRIKNKMIRPTSIPQVLEELVVEQAICREALRLSFDQHKALAVGLKGVQQERTIADVFTQSTGGETLVDVMGLDMVIGSGGVLSHAPRRAQSALMMMDAYLPEGVTELAVDSIFMMPQLGVLSKVHPEAATQVFLKDCLVRLGTCIAPVGKAREGKTVLKAKVTMPSGEEHDLDLKYGDLKVIPLEVGKKATIDLQPAGGIDVGEGKKKPLTREINGGTVGIIFDCRGRQPFEVPKDTKKRIEKLQTWIDAMDIYPREGVLARR